MSLVSKSVKCCCGKIFFAYVKWNLKNIFTPKDQKNQKNLLIQENREKKSQNTLAGRFWKENSEKTEMLETVERKGMFENPCTCTAVESWILRPRALVQVSSSHTAVLNSTTVQIMHRKQSFFASLPTSGFNFLIFCRRHWSDMCVTSETGL